jgi:hypothetical protein
VATFKITADKSIYSDGLFPVFGFAPSEDTPAADSFILDPNAAIVTKNNAILFGDEGAWTATFNGTIFTEVGTAINLLAGNKASSTFTIGAESAIAAGTDAFYLQSSATIKNSGLISGTDDAFEFIGAGSRTITNNASGIISGADYAIYDVDDLSTDKVTNAGFILGKIDLGGGNDTLANSGTINVPVLLGDGNNIVTNSGTIGGPVTLGNGDDKVTNSGTIAGDIITSAGKDTITNSGKGIAAAINAGDNDDTITNSGKITFEVTLGDGNNKITNSGTIGANILGGDGNDTVINSGTVSSVILGKGHDVFTNTGKFVNATLGDGDDKFIGSAKNEIIIDGNGADITNLGGGDDKYIASGSTGTDGNDTIDGGAGVDLYNAFGAMSGITINLDNIDHAVSEYGFGSLTKNLAAGTGVGPDSIKNIENVTGSDAAGDVIYGSAAANIILGEGGSDNLAGFGGNDTIFGGAGTDHIVGGKGGDRLDGGTGNDTFYYVALSDSGLTKATRDSIENFQAGMDKITLTIIDANTANGAATNDAFSWMDTNVNFGGVAGQLRAYWTPNGQIIEGDVNGDKKADFSIEIVDPDHSITLMATDFNL